MKFSANKHSAIAQAKAAKCSEVNAIRDQQLRKGLTFRGLTFDISPMSEAAMIVHGEGPCSWRSNENVMVPLTEQETKAFFGRAHALAREIREWAWEMKGEVEGLQTLSQIETWSHA